jgi:phage terminase large subunit
MLIKNSVPNDKLIIADSAATRTIQDLSLMGINIKPVKKNKITDDIKLLQEYQIIVEENSFNISRELNTWVWLDKRGEIPLDDNNHTIDPIRYYCQTILRKPNINIIQSQKT